MAEEGDSGIRFYNRYTEQIEEEKVYGDLFLRWVYGSAAGGVALERLVKRPLFSAWYGWRMNRPGSAKKIAPFVRDYGLDSEEFAEPLQAYGSFNEFFYRKLRADRRPIAPGTGTVVFPADGRHFGFQSIASMEGFYLKGQEFDLAQLLGSEERARPYREGSMLFSRLSPVDYHRFHFPVSGLPGPAECLNGWLYSVNPMALRRNLAYFWQNKRCVTSLATADFGEVLLVEIGATCVGGIVQTYPPKRAVHAGDEKGYFRFGASATMVFFLPGRVRLAADLVEWTSKGLETYAVMGDKCAERIAS